MLIGIETIRIETETCNGIVVDEYDFSIEDNQTIGGAVHDRFYN